MSETRQPLTQENAIISIMEMLDATTPTDAVRAVADLVNNRDTLAAAGISAAKMPSLIVTADGSIVIGAGMTTGRLMGLVTALQSMPLSGAPNVSRETMTGG